MVIHCHILDSNALQNAMVIAHVIENRSRSMPEEGASLHGLKQAVEVERMSTIRSRQGTPLLP